MKKYFIMIGNIALYGGVYFIISVTISLMFVFKVVIENLRGITDPFFLERGLFKDIQVIMIISAILSTIAYVLIMKLKKKNLIKHCNFSIPSVGNIIIITISAAAFTTLATIIVDITKVYQYFPDTMEAMGNLIFGDNFILSLLTIGILIPIFEEILFRGLIFNELRRTIDLRLAIIIQALIFGIAHMNLLQGTVTFFIGIIMGLVYVWGKSLWAPIIIHAVNNSISVVSAYYLPASFQFKWPYSIIGIVISLTTCLLMLKLFYNRSRVALKS